MFSFTAARITPSVNAIFHQSTEISQILKTIVSSDDQQYRKTAAIEFQQRCLLAESIEVCLVLCIMRFHSDIFNKMALQSTMKFGNLSVI